jgi:hypothetical protein
MSKEAMKLALEALEAGDYYIDDLEAIVYAADDLGTHEDRAKMQAAITVLRLEIDALNMASKPALAEQPAQQEPKIGIYRSFEQWKNGNVLEHGVPRTEHYSEAQLDLVEMGWNYGYDAGRAVEQALDKMADNARELGLDYEPVCNKDPQGCWNVRCQLGKKCKNTPAQRTWVWLTDKERNNLWREIIGWGDPSHDDEDLMKAIEDASRRKNT